MDGGIIGCSREEERAHVYIVHCMYAPFPIQIHSFLSAINVYIHTYLQTSYAALSNCTLEHLALFTHVSACARLHHTESTYTRQKCHFKICGVCSLRHESTDTYTHVRTPNPHAPPPTHCVLCTSSESLIDGHYMAAEDKQQTVKHTQHKGTRVHTLPCK